MSKVVDTVKSGVKSIVNGVKKVFKEITSSTVGKVALAAATIYLGGAALGAWNSPFQSINGALAGGAGGGGSGAAQSIIETGATQATAPTGFTASGATAGTANVASAGVPGAASAIQTGQGTINLGSLAGGGASAGSGAGGGFGAGAGGGAASGAGVPGGAGGGMDAVTTANNTLNEAARTFGAEGAKETGKGLISKAMGATSDAVKSGTNWMKENPMTTYMGMNALSSAASPDEIDMMREQDSLARQREEEERRRRERNLMVAGIDLGIRNNNGQRLTDMYGNPVYDPQTGIINRARG